MRRLMKLVSVVTLLAIVASLSASFVFAQDGEGEAPPGEGPPPGGERNDACREAMKALSPELMEALRAAEEEATADALDMTVEDLHQAREAGKNVPELAEEAGVDMADLHAAIEAARQGVLDDAVSDGTITQAEADVISECGPRGGGPGKGGPGKGGNQCMGMMDEDVAQALREAEDAAMATALGMTVDELAEARESGKHLHELAEKAGIDMADIQAAVEAARQDVLDDAVSDGTITQEVADAIAECFAQGPGAGGPPPDAEQGAPPADGGHGGPRPRGGPGGPPPQQAPGS